jgi:putative flippase GtrA
MDGRTVNGRSPNGRSPNGRARSSQATGLAVVVDPPATPLAESPVVEPVGLVRGLIGLVRGLVSRFEHLIHEVGKFGAVGLVSFAIDIIVFNLFLKPIGPLPAKLVSTVISASAAFAGNRFWTWRHRVRSGYGREYGLYFLFNAAGLGIGLSCLWLSHYALGSAWPAIFHTRLADNLSSLGVGMVFGTLFRFWAYRRIVFRAPDEAAKQAVNDALSEHPAGRNPHET